MVIFNKCNVNKHQKIEKIFCKKRILYSFFTFFLCFSFFIVAEKLVFAGGVLGKEVTEEEKRKLEDLKQKYEKLKEDYEKRRRALEEENRKKEEKRRKKEEELRLLEAQAKDLKEEKRQEEKKSKPSSEEEKKKRDEDRRCLEARITMLEASVHDALEGVFRARERSGQRREVLCSMEEKFNLEVKEMEEEKRGILRQSDSSEGESLRRREEVCQGIRDRRDAKREERKREEEEERLQRLQAKGITPEENREKERERIERLREKVRLREEECKRAEEEHKRAEEERKRAEEEHRRKEEEGKSEEERKRLAELEDKKKHNREEKEKAAQARLEAFNTQEKARLERNRKEEEERRLRKKAGKQQRQEQKRRKEEEDEALVNELLETLSREGRQRLDIYPGGEDPEVQRRGETAQKEAEKQREEEEEEAERVRIDYWRNKVRLRQETLKYLNKIDPWRAESRIATERALQEEEETVQKKEKEEYEKRKKQREEERARRRASAQKVPTPLDHASQQGSLHATQQAADASVSHTEDNKDIVRSQASSNVGGGAEGSSSKLKNNRIFIHRRTSKELHPLLQRGARLQVSEVFYSSEVPRRIFISAFGESRHRPKEKGYGGQLGIIINPVSRLRFGVSYSYISNDMKEYNNTNISSFGAMKTKTTTNVISGVAAWNIDKQGFTGFIIGSHGWGKVKTTRMFIHQGVHLCAKGKPEANVNSISAQIGYNISLVDVYKFFNIESPSAEGMLITPYFELSKTKSFWEPFKETECIAPACISSLKSSTYEEIIGLRYRWPINKIFDFQAWCSCITRQKRFSPLTSIIATKRKTYFFKVHEKKWNTTEAELGSSISIYLFSNLGTTITGSLGTNNFGSLSSKRINVTLWYDF